MRIRLLTGLVRCGDDGNHRSHLPGEVVDDWDDADAANLIERGYAEPVDIENNPNPDRGDGPALDAATPAKRGRKPKATAPTEAQA